jgi:hypothetical protein
MVGSRFHVADAASSQRSITVAKSSGVSGLATADALWTRRQRFRTMRACWSGGPIQLPQAPSSILGAIRSHRRASAHGPACRLWRESQSSSRRGLG